MLNSKRAFFILIVMFLVICFSLYITQSFQVKTVGSEVVINTVLTVKYGKFNGTTTNFTALNSSQLASIENMSLEIINSGKIIFTEDVNLTVVIGSNNTIYLEDHVNISNNFIYINTTHFPNLQKSAQLSLYGLSFVNPRVLRNGEVCPSSICTIVSYSGGNLTFNVLQFSNYSAEETPSSGSSEQSGSGGSGGTKREAEINFTINKKVLDVKIKQGKRTSENIIVRNTGNAAALFTLQSEGSYEYFMIEDKVFSLQPGEEKTVNINFFAGEQEKPDIHTARIIVNTGTLSKYVNVIVEISELRPLFDVKSELSEEVITRGRALGSEINLVNIGDLQRVDVKIEYFIEDYKGKRIKLKEETIGVEGKETIRRSFTIPYYIESGDYLFIVKVDYLGNVASGANQFTIVERGTAFYVGLGVAVLLIILIIMVLIVFVYKLRKRNRRR